jgi:transglutaminase-like putative cysteine protease
VHHRVEWVFAAPLGGATLAVRLSPRDGPEQRVLHQQLLVSPRPAHRDEGTDRFDNRVTTLELDGFTRLLVTAVTSARIEPRAPHEASVAELSAQLAALAPDAAWTALAPGASGRCRERTEVLIERLRASGVGARYVSGYELPARGGPTLPHAYCEVSLPSGACLEYDPSLGIVGPAHLRVAVGDGYADVAPLSGTLSRGAPESTAPTPYRARSTVTVEWLGAA